MSDQTLEQRVTTLEKEMAELKVQVSARPTDEVIREILKKINRHLARTTPSLLL